MTEDIRNEEIAFSYNSRSDSRYQEDKITVSSPIMTLNFDFLLSLYTLSKSLPVIEMLPPAYEEPH